MNKLIKYFLLLLLIFSCKSNNVDKPKKPDNLISKNKMIAIIYDISLMNAAKGSNKKLIENEGIDPENYIYTKHNIDSLQFVLSNEYYAYNLKTYEDIYDGVKLKLEKNRKHFNTIIETEKKIKDSINREISREFDSLKKIDKLIPKKKNSRKRLDSLKEQGKLKIKKSNPNPLKKIDTSQISTRQEV